MQINNLLFNFIKQNMPKENFQENSIIEAKIVSLENGLVSLEFNGQIITAKTDLELIDLLGQTMDFIIEEKTDTRLVIRPITQEILEDMAKTMETTINKAVREFGLDKSPLVEEFLGELIHEKLPINKENLDLGIRFINKLSQLISKEDIEIEIIKAGNEENQGEVADQGRTKTGQLKLGERTQLVDADLNRLVSGFGQEIPEEDLEGVRSNAFPAKDESHPFLGKKDDLSVRSKLLKEIISLEKVENSDLDMDIKNLLIKTRGPGESLKANREATSMEQTLDYIRSQAEDKDLVQLAKFFVKNKVRPSLANVKFTLELLKEPQVFAGKLREITEKIQDNTYLNKVTGEDLEKLFAGKDKEEVDQKIKTLIKGLEIQAEDKRDLLEIKDRLNFIKDLNKDMYFQNINFNYGQKGLEGFFNLIKEKENEFGAKKPISIFINLNTNNLGNISISCLAMDRDLSLRIGIDKADQGLFKSMEGVLGQRLNKLGYNLLDSKLVYDSDVRVLQGIDKTDSIYFLDIKV